MSRTWWTSFVQGLLRSRLSQRKKLNWINSCAVSANVLGAILRKKSLNGMNGMTHKQLPLFPVWSTQSQSSLKCLSCYVRQASGNWKFRTNTNTFYRPLKTFRNNSLLCMVYWKVRTFPLLRCASRHGTKSGVQNSEIQGQSNLTKLNLT